MSNLTFFVPPKGKTYGSLGDAITAAHDSMAFGKCRIANKQLLKHLLKNQQLIPKHLTHPGTYLIASGTQVITERGKGFPALNKSGKGWNEVVVYNDDRFAQLDTAGDKILIIV